MRFTKFQLCEEWRDVLMRLLTLLDGSDLGEFHEEIWKCGFKRLREPR